MFNCLFRHISSCRALHTHSLVAKFNHYTKYTDVIILKMICSKLHTKRKLFHMKMWQYHVSTRYIRLLSLEFCVYFSSDANVNVNMNELWTIKIMMMLSLVAGEERMQNVNDERDMVTGRPGVSVKKLLCYIFVRSMPDTRWMCVHVESRQCWGY